MMPPEMITVVVVAVVAVVVVAVAAMMMGLATPKYLKCDRFVG